MAHTIKRFCDTVRCQINCIYSTPWTRIETSIGLSTNPHLDNVLDLPELDHSYHAYWTKNELIPTCLLTPCRGRKNIIASWDNVLYTTRPLFVSSSSSSCSATSTDIPDPLSPLFPIVHRLWQVFRATFRILT